MKLSDLDINKSYTYADYATWPFEDRAELINGKVFELSPAPNSTHQDISSIMHGELYMFLRDKKCKVFSAPYDVLFPPNEAKAKDTATVLQPDIRVICDPRKITPAYCLGAPGIVVEILSPPDTKKDLKYKYKIYEESGCRNTG